MRHRAVLSAYGVWLDAVVESRTAALRAEKAAERSAFHDDLRSAEDLMNKRVMLSSAQRWNQRGLTKCLVSWQSWTLHKVAVRDMLKKVILRIQSLRCASAFDAWAGWSTRRRHVRLVCMRSVARLQNLAVSRAWSAWWSLRCLMVRVRGMAI